MTAMKYLYFRLQYLVIGLGFSSLQWGLLDILATIFFTLWTLNLVSCMIRGIERPDNSAKRGVEGMEGGFHVYGKFEDEMHHS